MWFKSKVKLFDKLKVFFQFEKIFELNKQKIRNFLPVILWMCVWSNEISISYRNELFLWYFAFICKVNIFYQAINLLVHKYLKLKWFIFQGYSTGYLGSISTSLPGERAIITLIERPPLNLFSFYLFCVLYNRMLC